MENNQWKKGETGAWVSIIAYVVLSISKLIMAQIGSSDALRADGLNNTTDIIASLAVLIGLRISRKPPDSDHHYGHSRAETISSLIAAFIMATIGIQVLFGAGETIVNRQFGEPSLLTGWTAVAGAVIMYGVYRFNLRLSRQVSSRALYAAAQDNRSDALVSIGAAVGIFGTMSGMLWMDPAAAVIVGAVILKTSWDIFTDATHLLTDGFDEDELHEIKSTISSHPEVNKVADVKARLQGNETLVDVIILVSPDITVQKAHDITDEIEILLEKNHHISYAHIHTEPYHG
ncbi:transporter [Salimicrobium jeotgali]|uniref:Cation efflux family protein n=1 Tax=Salimicrobium jeotgali TaxID=1230341 RepID=K2FHY9_9BACI|nr:cation diffusion facilitator family transporter [Salimicrobium jeotgali]AKG05041.1 transporter [Salimicrobium jeotgali]EKE30651.1 cation efflux family protein [Salimicrobium jeotgali]MBM7696886.1 cation diffusion facilitator family transporter [Salimicrobium jeotgali]